MNTSWEGSVGHRLRQERELRGWSQSELARRIDTPPQNINRWENNKSLPHPRYRKELSDAFGLSIEELFMSQKEKEEEEIIILEDKQVNSPLDQTSTSIFYTDHEMKVDPWSEPILANVLDRPTWGTDDRPTWSQISPPTPDVEHEMKVDPIPDNVLDRPIHEMEWVSDDIPKYEMDFYGDELTGRESLIREIFTKLNPQWDSTSITRFLVLTGIPGSGKSELARLIGKKAQLGSFPDVRPISLEHVTTSQEALDIIDDHLRERDTQVYTLVILDNCEGIADIDTFADALQTRLRQQEWLTLTILATSRVPFGVRWGGYMDNYEVPPLALVDAILDNENQSPLYSWNPYSDRDAIPSIEYNEKFLQKLRFDPAIRLFVQAVRETDEQYTLTRRNAKYIVDICGGLDGLPLGLRIAALRIKDLGKETLHKMLLDTTIQTLEHPLKKNKENESLTLETSIERSYGLLDEQAQKLFRRLAAFPRYYQGSRGISIHAATVICNLDDELSEDEDEMQLFHTLGRHNLIMFSPFNGHVGMTHTTLIDYGRRKLDQVGESEMMRDKILEYIGKLEYNYIMTEKYLKEKLKELAYTEGFMTMKFKGYCIFLFDDWFTEKLRLRFCIPVWAKALHSLLNNYRVNNHWNDTGCDYDLFTAWERLLDEYRKDTAEGQIILERFDRAFRQVCEERLQGHPKRDRDYFKSLIQVSEPISQIWLEWDRWLWSRGWGWGERPEMMTSLFMNRDYEI